MVNECELCGKEEKEGLESLSTENYSYEICIDCMNKIESFIQELDL